MLSGHTVRSLAVPALLIGSLACDRTPETEPAAEAEPVPTTALPAGALELRDVGFDAPESVLHDSVADVYLVSNINGGGRDRDDNGFISRVSPDGQLLDLKWIDGAAAAVTLSAPKGSAIVGDSLFVADLDSIRVFHRITGTPIRAIGIPNAVALNDLAVTADGAMWASDMGDGTPEVAARTGLNRIAPDGSIRLVVAGDSLDGPNGLAPQGDGVLVAAYRGRGVRSVYISESGRVGVEWEHYGPPGSRFDGLVALPDNLRPSPGRSAGTLVSSWDEMAVFRCYGYEDFEVVIDNLQSPADIGYDARRNRVLVPSFEGNWLRIYPLDAVGEAE